MPERGLTLSGARARLLLNNTKVGYATNVRYGEEIQRDEVAVLDSLHIPEYVAVRYRCNFSCQFVRLVTEPLKLREGIAIMPQLSRILTADALTATVEDPLTGTVLANIQQVELTRYDINLGATGIVLTDCEFVAIRIQDESEIT